MDKFQMGEMTFLFLDGNNFWCDAGKLFGPVPKVIWDKLVYTNQYNQVAQVCDPILVQYQGANILIDAGYGLDKMSEKLIGHEGVVGQNHTLKSLASLGLSREDIDKVILTHCHNDHIGGLSSLIHDGSYQVLFPNADIFVNELEWREIQNPPARTRQTYLAANWKSIEDQVVLWKGYYNLMEGIDLFHAKGHSIGHSIIQFKQGDQVLLHLADHLMSHLHIKPLWVPSIDDFPDDTIHSKEMWINYGLSHHAYFSFYHDPTYCLVRFSEDGSQVVESLSRSKVTLMTFKKEK